MSLNLQYAAFRAKTSEHLEQLEEISINWAMDTASTYSAWQLSEAGYEQLLERFGENFHESVPKSFYELLSQEQKDELFQAMHRIISKSEIALSTVLARMLRESLGEKAWMWSSCSDDYLGPPLTEKQMAEIKHFQQWMEEVDI